MTESSETAHERLLARLGQVVQVEAESPEEELGADLAELARSNDAVILAFIAPYVGVKVSPGRQVTAQIGLFEEYGIRAALAQIAEADPDYRKRSLWLLVHSPGGLIPSSYVVAKRLRQTFKDITAFVPHIATSGGTIITLAANRVVMGDFSRIGPVDPQVPYSQNQESHIVRVSANTMQRALDDLKQDLETTAPDEVTYPYQVLTRQVDPVLLQDWNAELLAVASYMNELLGLADYERERINRLIASLVYTAHPHDFVVDRERAESYGVNLEEGKDAELELMQEWLIQYMLRPEARHYIRYVVPAMERQNGTGTANGKGNGRASSGPKLQRRRVSREKKPVSGKVPDGADGAAQ